MRNWQNPVPTVYTFNTIATIVFLNKSHTPPSVVVWVCEDKETMGASLKELKAQSHIEILQSGSSHFQDRSVIERNRLKDVLNGVAQDNAIRKPFDQAPPNNYDLIPFYNPDTGKWEVRKPETKV